VAIINALQIVSVTDPGRIRGHNEDCVESRPEMGVVVLADGMGGYNAGEVASGMATSLIAAGLANGWTRAALKKLDREQASAFSQQLLQAEVSKANSAIFEAAQKDSQCAGMGTTLVACLFYDNFLTVGHIGDSRLYRMPMRWNRSPVTTRCCRSRSIQGLLPKKMRVLPITKIW